ncbi:right-handed parallel beta-helix repeat-containing protein [Sphingosinicellaceae bacterium]|nr:right-handed parallel beta-helix repeat-containing protein [Sphingosinicellaceae bacterium]
MSTKTITVANAAQLTAAIRIATGGETILLAAGDYGAVSIKGKMLGTTVTIKSADANHDATFSDLRIDKSSGFRIEDIDIHRTLATGESTNTQVAYVSGSSNIAMVGIDFTGSMDGNAANDGVALRVADSQGVSVTGSTFEQFNRAGLFSGDTGLTISGNTLTSVVKSFDLANLQDALISGNRFVGAAKGDWSTTGFDAHNVVVRDNIFTGAVAVVAAPVGGPGKILNVATNAQLVAALAVVKGGETILLAPGDYGTINIKAKIMTSDVTIKSADANHDAVFANIRIDKASGFVFNDVDVHRPLTVVEKDFTQAVYVSSSSHIGFVGVDFTGSMDGNAFNDGMGLRIDNGTDIVVADSTFEQWNNAAVFSQLDRLTVVGNSVTGVREGFDFVAVHDVTIAQNQFTSFTQTPTDHADAIQFWNNGANEGSSNVLIRDNVMLFGASGGVQGIFIRAEDPAYRYSNFTIENNLYNGDARHGITVTGVDGGIVRGNTVTSAPGGYLEAGINVGNSSKILIDHNVAPLLLDNGNAGGGVVWSSNIDLWDSKQKTGIALDSIFATKNGATGLNIAAYALKAGGAADLLHAGFTTFDGIGAGAFDLTHLSSYANLGGAAATLAHIA